MSASAPSPYDASFASILKSCQAEGMGGELKFVDNFFSFLRRQTKLLSSPSAVEQVQGLALKHVDLAKKQPTKPTPSPSSTPAAAASSTSAPASSSSSSSASSSASSPASSSSSSAPSEASATTLPDAEMKDAEDDLPAPINNGGITSKYSWTQTLSETTVTIPLPAGTSSKQLKIVIEPNRLHAELLVGDKTVYFSGEPDEKISSADATWTIETDKGQKVLEIYLPKLNKMSWWKCVVKGDPQINTKKIVPENSKLEDLDGDTRGTVEKMMFDQRQKQMGKPSSDEMQKQAALKKFMDAHPEMDFSQAKIS